MSAPDLAELRRLLAELHYATPWHTKEADPRALRDCDTNRFAVFNDKHTASVVVAAVNALPYLLAKVEAAERLAEVAEVAMCNDDMDLIDAIEDFRKAGAP